MAARITGQPDHHWMETASGEREKVQVKHIDRQLWANKLCTTKKRNNDIKPCMSNNPSYAENTMLRHYSDVIGDIIAQPGVC